MTRARPEDQFPASGCPTYLEWYKCFANPGQRWLIDGEELKENEESWDEKQRAKWRFFYRSVKSAIGRPQKRRIRWRERAISWNEKRLAKLTPALIRDLLLCVLGVTVTGLAGETALAIIALAIALIRTVYTGYVRSQLSTKNDEHQTEIARLEAEIAELREQMDTWSPSEEQVEEWLVDEIRAMERKCLAEIVNTRSDDPRLFDAVRHEPVEAPNNPYGLHGLLIEGWGLLQPSTVHGPFGKERTAVRRVAKDLGMKIASWRRGPAGQPIYRVVYLQYIFLLEKNINVYSFFYDFVTRKQYGKRTETFQYNHVTNYSIRQVDHDAGDWVQNLKVPRNFRSELLDKEYNAFSMAVSSSAHFRCVLSDNTVVDAINQWLDAEEELRNGEDEVEAEAAPSGNGAGHAESPRSTGAGQEAAADTEGSEADDNEPGEDDEDREEILRELAEHRDRLETQDVHLARRALQQVREEVENYVQFVQPTGSESETASHW